MKTCNFIFLFYKRETNSIFTEYMSTLWKKDLPAEGPEACLINIKIKLVLVSFLRLLQWHKKSMNCNVSP